MTGRNVTDCLQRGGSPVCTTPLFFLTRFYLLGYQITCNRRGERRKVCRQRVSTGFNPAVALSSHPPARAELCGGVRGSAGHGREREGILLIPEPPSTVTKTRQQCTRLCRASLPVLLGPAGVSAFPSFSPGDAEIVGADRGAAVGVVLCLWSARGVTGGTGLPSLQFNSQAFYKINRSRCV